MWSSRASAPRDERSTFREFMEAEEHPRPRPRKTGLHVSTAKQNVRMVRQIYRETGNLLSEEDAPWETSPPLWQAIYEWRNRPEKGGPARLESHRKALVWLASYWGLNGDQRPSFIDGTWAHARAKRRAKESGLWKRRELFLRLPDDVAKLLSARPFEDNLKRSHQWWCLEERRRVRYLDKMWRTLIHLGVYGGNRQAEFATLRFENIDWQRAIIRGWEQPKKHNAPRDMAIPERWVVLGDGRHGPALEWFVKHVRPEVSSQTGPRDHVFLTYAGKPYAPSSIRNLVSDGIHLALGRNDISGHSLRRACATWRYYHGWDIQDIADLLDDLPKVVEGSYLDRAWLKTAGRKARRGERYPCVEWIRPAGRVDSVATPRKGGRRERQA
ncbi:MAG TPA: site-specific integrase, partial [Candidatus Thermoplasmatota archaeon]|nr:site-specific integrase [Candidatus Thermoplasmatota archaeon]